MVPTMTDSFWTGGPKAYAEALRKEFEPQINELRKRCDDADATEREKFDAEIERLESEYKSKLDSINDSLF